MIPQMSGSEKSAMRLRMMKIAQKIFRSNQLFPF